MKKVQVVIRRSAARMWLLGLAGIPMLVIAVEYVWRPFGFADKLGDWTYRGGEVEAFEIRDDALMGALGLLGILFVLISVKELLAPRKMIVANETGMKIALSGPLKRASEASWLQIKDLVARDSSLIVQLNHRGELPNDPWGARWLDESTLEIGTTMWERGAEKFINQIAALDLPNAVRQQAIDQDTLRNFDSWSDDFNHPPPAPLPVEEAASEQLPESKIEAPQEPTDPPEITPASPLPAADTAGVIEEAGRDEEPKPSESTDESDLPPDIA